MADGAAHPVIRAPNPRRRPWQTSGVPVAFNHTIVHSRDAQESATFFSEIMGLPAPAPFGPFLMVPLEHGGSLDFATTDTDISPQHYAFLVTEDDFDAIYGRIVERGIEHYPEPHLGKKNAINHNDGGRGVYWSDPSGHFLEIITVPYGGWPTGVEHQP
jgi:catechol 2,3-dioxygenase-like lactoylglutathione lyase family enzyme